MIECAIECNNWWLLLLVSDDEQLQATIGEIQNEHIVEDIVGHCSTIKQSLLVTVRYKT